MKTRRRQRLDDAATSPERLQPQRPEEAGRTLPWSPGSLARPHLGPGLWLQTERKDSCRCQPPGPWELVTGFLSDLLNAVAQGTWEEAGAGLIAL